MHFLEIFGQKKCLFESKTVFLGQEVHYYIMYIAYFTELNLQICNFAQKWRICRENCNYALDENFQGHFCPRRKAAKFCHPGEKTASFKANNQGQWVSWKINWCGSCVVVSYNISLLSCPAPPWSSCPPSQDPAAIWSPNSPLTNPVVTQLVRVMKMHEEGFKQRTDLDSRIYSNSTTLLLV